MASQDTVTPHGIRINNRKILPAARTEPAAPPPQTAACALFVLYEKDYRKKMYLNLHKFVSKLYHHVFYFFFCIVADSAIASVSAASIVLVISYPFSSHH